MGPRGWLDIHGHYALPTTDKENEQQAKAYRAACFMVDSVASWDPEAVIKYNDKATVAMQMLSVIPHDHDRLRKTNDYGNEVVRKYPQRFGLLAALPMDDADAALAEITRTDAFEPKPDGYAVSTAYKTTYLSDDKLEPVWKELNEREAVVHIHPNGTAEPTFGRTVALMDVAFDTARVVVDMVYKTIFKRYNKIKFILAHCGGALPVMAGRLSLLGTEAWVPNPHKITRDDLEKQLHTLWVDTAASAKTALGPAVKMVGKTKCVYGADCGVPCSTEATMEENRRDVEQFEIEAGIESGQIATNGWALFPNAAVRAGKFGKAEKMPMM